MVRLATAGNPRFSVDPAEVDSGQASYTVPTLERLREQFGTRQPLVLLLGADAYAGLPGWHRWRELLELAHLAVAHRPGYPVTANALPAELADLHRQCHVADAALLAAAPAGCITTFAMTPLAISASQARQILAEGRSPRYLLPPSVIDYIELYHLYRSNDGT
jgi:nicotinate-nucleotide adenylyltransferase